MLSKKWIETAFQGCISLAARHACDSKTSGSMPTSSMPPRSHRRSKPEPRTNAKHYVASDAAYARSALRHLFGRSMRRTFRVRSGWVLCHPILRKDGGVLEILDMAGAKLSRAIV